MAHRIPLGLFRLAPGPAGPKRPKTLHPPPLPGFHWRAFEGDAPDRAVLLVHGLDEPGRIWDDLAPALAAHDLPVVRFDYPNDQPIAHSADLLLEAVQALADRGARHLDLVAHSMGGLLSRDILTRPGVAHATQPLIPRLVTVGTPNAGSVLARSRWVAEVREQLARWADSPGWLPPGSASPRTLRGGAARDLLPNSGYLAELNARGLPGRTRITVIYGHWWPVLPREDSIGRSIVNAFGDGVVSLAAALLPGVDDHVQIPGNHRTMLRRMGARAILRARTGRHPDGPLPPAVPIILDRLLRPADGTTGDARS